MLISQQLRLPITDKLEVREQWAQAEYVECMLRGYGFAAHGDYWHYKIGPERITLWVSLFSEDHKLASRADIKDPLNWIEEARAAIARAEGEDR